MKPFNDKEFTELTLKIARSKYAIQYIPELISIYENKEGQEDYLSIKFTCETWLTLIYQANGLYEKAFVILLRQLKELAFDDSSYYGPLHAAIKCAEVLERNDEVVSYALGFLSTLKQHFSSSIGIIDWYVTHYSDSARHSIDIAKSAFEKATTELELDNDPLLPFEEQVHNANRESRRGAQAFQRFQIDFGKAQKEDQAKMLTDYLTNESLAYYRNIATKLYGRDSDNPI